MDWIVALLTLLAFIAGLAFCCEKEPEIMWLLLMANVFFELLIAILRNPVPERAEAVDRIRLFC